eukprot:scaffold12907_cov68-Cyclotella_meneghiniana.AAC.5
MFVCNDRSLFFTSWMTFIISLICLKAYIERSLPSHSLPGAAKSQHFDDSFRTCGTLRTPVTDIDDSFKLTDDELEACIRQHTPEPSVSQDAIQVKTQVEMTEQLDSHVESFDSKPSVSRNDTRSRRAVEPSGVKVSCLPEPKYAKKAERQVKSHDESFHPEPFISPKDGILMHDEEHACVQTVGTPKNEPVVLTRSQCDVSTLGISSADPVTQSPFMYPISVATESTDCEVTQPEEGLNVLRRRASYCSVVPSLQAVPEGSESSTRDKSKGSKSNKTESNKTKLSKSLTSTNRVAESSKAHRYKIKRRGNGSLPDSTSEEYSIYCDSKSTVTDITAETSDTPRTPPRKPDTNMENGNCATPRLNTLNSSVDDLVASAVFFARQSRLQKTSHNESRITMTTMSPNPSSSDTSSYPKHEHERFQSLLKRKESDEEMDVSKAKRRKSINSLYSSNSADINAEGDFYV